MKIKLFTSAVLSVLFLLLTAQNSQSSVKSLFRQESPGAVGAEKPLHKQTDKTTGNACYVFKEYIVKTVSSEDLGEDIKVFKRNGEMDFKKACANDKRKAYMTVANTDANYFFGLTGDKFLVDSGTSAGARGLDVVSLTSKKTIYSTDYNETVKISESFLIFNKPSDKSGSLKNCPQAKKWKKQGGGVGWTQPMRLNLMTLKATSAGRLTCIYME